MTRVFVAAAFGLVLFAGGLLAADHVGTIRKVDAEKGILLIRGGGGEDHTVTIAKDVKVLGKDGKDLPDGLKSRELKEGTVVTVTVEQENGRQTIKAIRLGGKLPAGGVKPPPPPQPPRESVGLKPLNEMSATDKYKGEDGGLYGGGKNEPPAEHQAAAKKATAEIQPLGPDGKPSSSGKIGLISLSMSNWTNEFSVFKQIADQDSEKSQRVTIVDCAQGGITMARWADPKGKPWEVADERLKKAGITPAQVQVVWIKIANAGPRGELQEHGKQLQKDTVAVLQNAKVHFPNLRIVLLESRIYAGYANTGLNPEPYAYEGAFVVRWLIQDQIKGDKELNYDPSRGPVKAPVLLWGAYLWGDGLTPRKTDGLVWKREDLAGDGTHPSTSGRRKVAELLLKFCKSDPNAKTWFVKK